MISDNASSHVVSSVNVGKSHVFSTFELSNMNLVFLTPNVTSVVRSLSLSYYSIFQNSIQVQTFAVGFVTI
jgi:hypothetical protein